MRAGFLLLGLVLVLLLASAAFAVFAWRPSLGPLNPPPPSSFDATLIKKGAELSLIGNCNVCHTAEGGAPYAGGRPLKTPFGTIYATNITPDPETGIGRWSEAAFARAMREGVDRDGRHLYPAFPYDHYTRMSDEDLSAVYAFIMTRTPVRADAPANDLAFPFNIRSLLAGWKALYLRPGAFEPDGSQSAEWNRGAYLVEGAAHCGACHTPRNFLGAERKRHYLAGGESEGWHAPALNAGSPAPTPWTTDTLYRYLRQGIAERHPAAAGPMVPVVRNLSTVSQEDVQAIAVYVASFQGQVTPERQQRADQSAARADLESAAAPGDAAMAPDSADPTLQMGRAIYVGACAACHESGRRTPSSGGALHLEQSTSVNLPRPRNFIHIVFDGITPGEAERGAWMPGFAGALTDEQVAALARYVRAGIARAPQWSDVEGEVSKVQRERQQKEMAAAAKSNSVTR